MYQLFDILKVLEYCKCLSKILQHFHSTYFNLYSTHIMIYIIIYIMIYNTHHTLHSLTKIKLRKIYCINYFSIVTDLNLQLVNGVIQESLHNFC